MDNEIKGCHHFNRLLLHFFLIRLQTLFFFRNQTLVFFIILFYFQNCIFSILCIWQLLHLLPTNSSLILQDWKYLRLFISAFFTKKIDWLLKRNYFNLICTGWVNVEKFILKKLWFVINIFNKKTLLFKFLYFFNENFFNHHQKNSQKNEFYCKFFNFSNNIHFYFSL